MICEVWIAEHPRSDELLACLAEAGIHAGFVKFGDRAGDGIKLRSLSLFLLPFAIGFMALLEDRRLLGKLG